MQPSRKSRRSCGGESRSYPLNEHGKAHRATYRYHDRLGHDPLVQGDASIAVTADVVVNRMAEARFPLFDLEMTRRIERRNDDSVDLVQNRRRAIVRQMGSFTARLSLQVKQPFI